jgi:enoyl-CoA hydratase/carnithine racemase
MATACDFRVISDNVALRIPELALGIPNVWNGTPLLAREVGLPTARDWVMTTRKVLCDELKQSGWAQRVATDDALEGVTEQLINELLNVPAAALAMTRSMTSALGRSASGMSMGWADADLQQWALTEEEYKETVRSYARQLANK